MKANVNNFSLLISQNNGKNDEKKYVVKNFDSQTYYAGELSERVKSIDKKLWDWRDPYGAEYFDSIEEAENFISSQEHGSYQIELVYIVPY